MKILRVSSQSEQFTVSKINEDPLNIICACIVYSESVLRPQERAYGKKFSDNEKLIGETETYVELKT